MQKELVYYVHGDFIIGLPGETLATIMETKKAIRMLKPDILQVSVATPFPGTEFYSEIKKSGYLITDDLTEYLDSSGHQKAIISYENLSNEEITHEVDCILKDYYFSIKYAPIAIRQIVRKNGLHEANRLFQSAKTYAQYVFQRN